MRHLMGLFSEFPPRKSKIATLIISKMRIPNTFPQRYSEKAKTQNRSWMVKLQGPPELSCCSLDQNEENKARLQNRMIIYDYYAWNA